MTNITHPSIFKESIEDSLTALEKTIITESFVHLLHQTNENKKIYGRDIIGFYKAKGHQLTQIRLCKWVSFARQKNLFAPKILIGSSRGYFLTDDVRLVEHQLESFQSRIYGLEIVYDSILAQKQNLMNVNKSKA